MKLELKSFGLGLKDRTSKCTSVVVSDKVFRYPFNSALVHQVVSSYLINSRQGSKSQKSRSEVAGSTKKPWRQKGTGRARSGSLKSPIWRSGGVTFAAKPKKYAHKVNKKMYKGAIKSILSRLVTENRLFLVESLFLEKSKTKFLLEKLKYITSEKSILIFTDYLDRNLLLASRNIYKVEIRDWSHVDPVSLINFNVTLIVKTIIEKIERQLL